MTRIMLGLLAVLAIGLLPAYADTPSPLQQYNSGTPIDGIQCSIAKILMESKSGKPYCLSENTANKLADRGFSVVILKENIEINYDDTKDSPSPSDSAEIQAQNLQNTTRPVLDAVSDIISNNEIDKTFDTLYCLDSSDDPLIIKKCWDEKIISEKLDCQGLNYHNPGCDPPETIYRKAPVFFRDSYADVIPQDITFDYQLKMPPDDRDAFVQKMIVFLDDELKDTFELGNGGKRYETVKGSIQVSGNMVESFAFTYTIIGVGRVDPNDGKQFTFDLLNELGIVLDGTEFYREGVQGFSNYSYQYWQTKDSMIVKSNWIATTIEEGYTKIYINNWNDNLSEMNLYDVEESIKNGREYSFNNKVLTGIDCQLSLFDGTDGGVVTLIILEGRPIYEMYAGRCQVQYADGHNGWYSVYVDALTGVPLYIQSRTTF